MIRQSWKSNLQDGELYISYSNPFVVPYNEYSDITIDDIMYYYYDIQIIEHGNVIFKHTNSDSKNVIDLPEYIDKIVNDDMKDSYIMHIQDDEYFGYEHMKYVSAQLNSGWDQDYSIRIERYDWVVVSDTQTFSNSNYTLTIGKPEKDRRYGGMHRENYGQYTIIERLSKSDLIRLRDTCNHFNQLAVDNYNNTPREEYECE